MSVLYFQPMCNYLSDFRTPFSKKWWFSNENEKLMRTTEKHLSSIDWILSLKLLGVLCFFFYSTIPMVLNELEMD